MKNIFVAAPLVSYLVLAAARVSMAVVVPISQDIPGSTYQCGSGPCPGPIQWVGNFYKFALAMSGVLAFGAMVYGGLRYTLAAGNPSGQSEAKEWIWSAVQGIILLAAAYLILRTINPRLTQLNLPTIRSVRPFNNIL